MKTDISEKKPSAKKAVRTTAAERKPSAERKSSEKSAERSAAKKTAPANSEKRNTSAKKTAATAAAAAAAAERKPSAKKAVRKTAETTTAPARKSAKTPVGKPAEKKQTTRTGRAAPADETAFLRTLGLAARARQTVMGTDMVCDALAEHRIRLVVEAGDTSENTHKRLTDKCITYRTPHVRLLSDGGTLGAALGKAGALAVCGVTGEIAKSLFSAWERLTGSAPSIPEKVAKTKK